MRGGWIRRQLRELAVDRSRTILVLLGVVWGTLCLTIVLSFGEGFHAGMSRALRGAGQPHLRFWGGATTQPFAGMPAGRWIGLVPEDGRLIQERVPGVSAVSCEFTSYGDPVEYRDRRTNGRVHGVSPSYGMLRHFLPQPGGRFLNERDEAKRRRVAFLGWEVKARLFGSKPAVGKTITVWGLPFTVIGVLRPKIVMGYYEGHDREKVLIPARTFQAIRGWRYCSYLLVGLSSRDTDEAVLKEIYRVLGASKGFDPNDTAAIAAYSMAADDRKVTRIVAGIRTLIGIVGLFGLLVALIGVANVMYVMVEERRREIGIQMALGARPARLMAGFFVEGFTLTAAGGAIGVLAGAAVLWLFNQVPLGETARGYLGSPVVSVVTALVVTLCLGVAGCAAGYFPATKAAAVNPVEALHEE